MKIALIGPGIMNIPPPGHGAVEILIWDYYIELKKQGYHVDIINLLRQSQQDQSRPDTLYCKELIYKINTGNYDFVHLHYDCLYHILPFLNCKLKAITSHYPYIDQTNRHNNDGYSKIFQNICNNTNHIIFALSKKDMRTFKENSVDKSKIILLLNGSNHNVIRPIHYKKKSEPNKSIYIAKIEERKQQHIYKEIPNINFYGKCDDNKFKNLPCFKGEYIHDELLSILVNHGNLVLLSNGENGTPLVIKEALMAGLPIVTNRYSIDDLDAFLPFVDIIPDDKLYDLQYIQNVIENNLKKQDQYNEIREYAVSNFSWEFLVKKYIKSFSSMN